MSERRESLGFGLLALVPIACCVGLPMLAAAGVSIGAVAWVGGITLAVLVLIVGVVLFTLWVRRHRYHRPTSTLGAHK